MSWIISAIWLWDLWKYHRDSKAKVAFDKQNSTSQDQNASPEEQAKPSQTIAVEMNADNQGTS